MTRRVVYTTTTTTYLPPAYIYTTTPTTYIVGSVYVPPPVRLLFLKKINF